MYIRTCIDMQTHTHQCTFHIHTLSLRNTTPMLMLSSPPTQHAYLMLHLEVLHQVEVGEHADGAQSGVQVWQLEVAKGEVGDSQGLRWGHHSGLRSWGGGEAKPVWAAAKSPQTTFPLGCLNSTPHFPDLANVGSARISPLRGAIGEQSKQWVWFRGCCGCMREAWTLWDWIWK